MDNTTLDDFFNPADPFALEEHYRLPMLAGFTPDQVAANDPLVLGRWWRPSWQGVAASQWPAASLIGGSAPVDTPLCNTGCQNTSLGEAGLKDAPNTQGGGEVLPVMGCPPPPPLAAAANRPRVTPAPSLGAALPSSGIVVDFLNFTYPVESDVLLDALKQSFGDDWQEMEKPFYSYRSGVRCGNIVILWAGPVEGMGVHVQMSGQGCRELEARHLEAHEGELDWRGWLRDRVQEGARFGQTHLALDDLAGMISVGQINEAFRAGHCVTRFGTFQPIETFGRDGELTAHGFNFGKRAQDTSICIYDKRLEQLQKDKGKAVDVEEYARKVAAMEKGWTRVELRNRNKRSHALVLRVVEEGWGVVAGVLRGYLDIRVPDGDTNKSRWEVAEWWGSFCSWAETARLKVEGVVKTLQTAMAWIDRQVGTALAMVSTVLPDAPGFLAGVVSRGAARFGKRHLSMMSAYLRAAGPSVAVSSASLRPSDAGVF